jgi:phage terminase large subunit-like protein
MKSNTLETSSYNGNSNLKRKGTSIEFSNDMISEYLKCAKDPIYFAEKYIQIVHVDHGLIPIKMYDYQKEIATAITENRRVAVNTSRQAGKTTTAVAIILHYVLFNDYKTVALLANKGDAAREILDRIKIAYEALPKWLQQGVIEWNKGSVEFENGCKVIAGSTSSSAIRGKSISFLYIDETAFVENWDEFFASVFPTISSGNTTKILFTSTPNGLNHFYKTCEGAREKRNGYIYIEVPWNRVPGRDEKWKKETLEGMDFDMQKFSQEFECVTGDTLVRVKCIETGKIKSISISELYNELLP